MDIVQKSVSSYTWYPAYWAALGELDDNLVAGRLYEAIAAIEQRQLTPVEGPEAEAIWEAEQEIEVLRAERLGIAFGAGLPV